MTKFFAALGFAGVMAVAGCEAPTSTVNSATSAQLRSFVKDAVTAEVIADECGSISMRYSTETLTESFVNQLIAAGHSPADIYRANASMNDVAMANDIVASLVRSGVNLDSPASFCAYGRQQMAGGTRVGSFLR